MIGKLTEFIWKFIPPRLRIAVVRFFQAKFTVSVVGVVTNEKGELLVLEHYFRPKYKWGLPGGFIEAFEPPEEAVKREIKEEADVDILTAELLSVRTIGRHVEIFFKCKGTGKGRVASKEIKACGWFSSDNLPPISPAHLIYIESFFTEHFSTEPAVKQKLN
ncbi:MAG: NUDIX hydrolase [Pyrinomonadaceae bacterium]